MISYRVSIIWKLFKEIAGELIAIGEHHPADLIFGDLAGLSFTKSF